MMKIPRTELAGFFQTIPIHDLQLRAGEFDQVRLPKLLQGAVDVDGRKPRGIGARAFPAERSWLRHPSYKGVREDLMVELRPKLTNTNVGRSRLRRPVI